MRLTFALLALLACGFAAPAQSAAPAPAQTPAPPIAPAPIIPAPMLPAPVPVPAPVLTLPAEVRGEVGDSIAIDATTTATDIRWLILDKGLKVVPARDNQGRLIKHPLTLVVKAKKAGTYRVAAIASSKDGISDHVTCNVVVEPDKDAPPVAPPGPGPTPPGPTPPQKVPNPVAATVQLRFGNSGCTATIVWPRRADGRWDVLTASHCTGGVGNKGQIKLKDGRTFPVTVMARNTTPDITWMVAETTADDLPYAVLASTDPVVGTAIWHNGYGIDKPGNREDGTVAAGQGPEGMLRFKLNVSSGDSGGGIFRADSGELVACVCCTAGKGVYTSMWGGSAVVAAKMRPGSGGGGGGRPAPRCPDCGPDTAWEPTPIPEYDFKEPSETAVFSHASGERFN